MIQRQLEQKRGRRPELWEIAQEGEAKPEDMDVLLCLLQHPISLEAPCSEDQPGRCLGDFLPDDSRPAVDDRLQQEGLQAEIKRILCTLTAPEAQVLCMYYGLDGQEPMTLEGIGVCMGRTRERVRQIKEKALQKLRHSSRNQVLKEYFLSAEEHRGGRS